MSSARRTCVLRMSSASTYEADAVITVLRTSKEFTWKYNRKGQAMVFVVVAEKKTAQLSRKEADRRISQSSRV